MKDSDNHESNLDNSKTKPDESIKVMSVDDEKIKTVGEVLSNDSSRAILKILANKEMSTNQISQDTDLSIALVAFHLKKMQDVGIIKMTRTGKSVKGQDVKYYSATNQSFLITPARHADSILESVKRYSRFAAIGIAGLVSWVILRKEDGKWNSGEEIPITLSDPDTIPKEPRLPPSDFMHGEDASSNPPVPSPETSHSGVQELNPPVNAPDATVHLDKTVYPVPFGTSVESIESILLSLLVPIAVIVSGIIINILVSRWMNKKKIHSNV
jgi:DNA-binding transcriptional ArsR family regulator